MLVLQVWGNSAVWSGAEWWEKYRLRYCRQLCSRTAYRIRHYVMLSEWHILLAGLVVQPSLPCPTYNFRFSSEQVPTKKGCIHCKTWTFAWLQDVASMYWYLQILDTDFCHFRDRMAHTNVLKNKGSIGISFSGFRINWAKKPCQIWKKLSNFLCIARLFSHFILSSAWLYWPSRVTHPLRLQKWRPWSSMKIAAIALLPTRQLIAQRLKSSSRRPLHFLAKISNSSSSSMALGIIGMEHPNFWLERNSAGQSHEISIWTYLDLKSLSWISIPIA